MAKTADALIEELSALHPKGFDLSLGRILRLLARLGNPHLQLPPVLHIAGTNGKGSAAAFSRALLEAAGYKVHVHTSPHLVRWHERYRLGRSGGGKYVEDGVLAEALMRIIAANGQEKITVFEIMTAAAFVLFAEYPADAVILEVGLGGRCDATNVIDHPAVALIMSISLDHQAYLGERLEDIAIEKAGIIKRGRPVVIGCQQNLAICDLLLAQAEAMKAPCVVFGQDYQAFEEHGRMVFQNSFGCMDLPRPALQGQFQIANAAGAIEAVQQAGFSLSHQAAMVAMNQVVWPARLQKLSHGRLKEALPANVELWLDGGHNPEAGQMVAHFLKQKQQKTSCDILLICGMINSKDAREYLRSFQECASDIYTVPVMMSDAGIDATELASIAHSAGLAAKPVASLKEAIRKAVAHIVGEKPLMVMICGSLYLAGEALKHNETPPL